jgi:hypothetical protein
VGDGAVEQQVFQVLQLSVTEAGLRPRVGLGGQAVGVLAGLAVPAVQGVAAQAGLSRPHTSTG